MTGQAELPRIWAEGWTPSGPLADDLQIEAESARIELFRTVLQRHPAWAPAVRAAWDEAMEQTGASVMDGVQWHTFSEVVLEALMARSLQMRQQAEEVVGMQFEVIPRRETKHHWARRAERMRIEVALALRRVAWYNAITPAQRLEWHRLMWRTRHTDAEFKRYFSEGTPTPDGTPFGGKGFRSTWQEAIVAAASALELATEADDEAQPTNPAPTEVPQGDIIAPMIRDVGLALAMGSSVTSVLAAQMGKAGSPMDGGIEGAGGRDLHVGAWHQGVLPPTAPLPIASATTVGVALAAKRLDLPRFQLACIGEGGSSHGEWWEALNLAGVRGLPIAMVLQNNQIALDTVPVHQSAVELWGDKADAVGIPAWTIDGTDPAAIFASVATARELAMDGGGATLIHIEAMRGCGHAHHHDDLYLGAASGNPPGYVDRDLLAYWADKDPIPAHSALLQGIGIPLADIEAIEAEEAERVQVAVAAVDAMPWADPATLTQGVLSFHDAPTQADQFARRQAAADAVPDGPLRPGEDGLEFSTNRASWTYQRAIQRAMQAIAERYGDRTMFFGEDMEIAGAFGLNLALVNGGFKHLLVDAPLSESAIIHAATGAAIGGMRPMAEIQFGGFLACALNPLLNNAAQLRWRWGAPVPLTVRVPYGGRTRGGPFHARSIEAWLMNDPGLVVLAPSTPQDAFDLLVEAAALDDPVVFLEHIGLYGLRGSVTNWGDSINQLVSTDGVREAVTSGDLPHRVGKAAVVRGGRDATLVTWGAMVHVARHAAATLAKAGIELEIVDLRTLAPFDVATCVQSVQRTGRFAVLQEAAWSGGWGQTVSNRVLEETFWGLEAAPVVIGSLDTPTPFAPPLEDAWLPTPELVVEHITALMQ